MNEEEPFLKRWSRRKLEAREAPATPAADGPPEQDARPPGEPAPEPAAEAGPGEPPAARRALTEADFADVDFDALDYQSDYARFMAPGVPESIRQKALHKLWASSAVFTDPDPFQDYIGDYTDAAVAVPPGTLKTAYKIGRGFLSDAEVAEWEKLGKPAAAEAEAKAAAAAGTAAPAAAQAAVAIAAESADQPEVAALLRQSDAYMASLYPAESNHLVDVDVLCAANARFLVARREGVAVGCGALILGADGEAEIKRMFVDPGARGASLGRRLLTALEDIGRQEGVRVLRLETGVRQPEALGLYRACGYTERGPFGTYQVDPLSTFFEKWIG